ncbi:MAG: hypothetical protein WCF96_04380 [Eubacteriales bacterium]
MIKKRNKFWTLVFSMLPGAGHMYNGFMKLGVSLMALFFAVAFLSATLDLGPLMLLAPVIWFYSFFDCINKRFLDDEEFYAQEDYYLTEVGSFGKLDFSFFKRHKLIIGLGLILVGIYSLLENTMGYILNNLNLSDQMLQAISEFIHLAPQLIVSIVIIAIGIMLINGKKRQVSEEIVSNEIVEDKIEENANDQLNQKEVE